MEAAAAELTELASSVLAMLRGRGETLATAESLTGGLVGAAITAVPGASTVYRGGVISYASEVKQSLLGVPAEVLAERGAVDPEVAAAMAEGARTRLGATWGLGFTGVAGPEPQDGKPVGTVFVALAGPDGPSVVSLLLSGERDVIRVASCREGLRALYARLARDE
ncbi:MAG TPA: nicotinamide-nucleotide amidohydrolase family protein [Mycobacteriales bacterium]|nr:nicotinamide-nucleotide amidohydrolase family protein [Mycobacteriales bacterium]